MVRAAARLAFARLFQQAPDLVTTGGRGAA